MIVNKTRVKTTDAQVVLRNQFQQRWERDENRKFPNSTATTKSYKV